MVNLKVDVNFVNLAAGAVESRVQRARIRLALEYCVSSSEIVPCIVETYLIVNKHTINK